MTARSLAVAVVAGLLFAPPCARAADVGGACKNDNECPLGSICGDHDVCVALPKKKSVIPFYFHQPGESGYRHVIPLLYFHTWDKHDDTRVQLPFFARSIDRDNDRKLTVVPLLFSSVRQTRAATEFRIWPILWAAKYRPDGGQAALLPLFWWQRRHDHTWLVFPPLLSGGQRDDVNDVTEVVVLLAGYYRRHGDDTWRVLFPVLFEHETHDARTLIAPFIWWKRSRTHEAGVVFPILWQVSDSEKGYEHTLALPLFDFESENHGRQQRVISILGAYERDDDLGVKQVFVWAPPVYHRVDNKRTVDVIPPLFTRWTTTDDYSRGLIAFPFAWSGDANGSTATLFPIYWRFHDNAHDATTHILFPVAAFHHHTGARGGFVGPVYGWSSSNGAGGWGAGIAPVLMFGRSGARTHALVLPLFAFSHDAAKGSTTVGVGPLYVRKTRDGGDGGLFPLVFAGRHGAESYAFVTPIYWHRGDAGGSIDIVGPLYWTHGVHGWGAGLAPVFFFGKLDGRSHQVIFPLFWHFSDARAHQERLVVGPYYHRRDGDETADVLFPLVYLRRSPHEGFGLWPIGGWVRDHGVDTTVVFPFVQRTDERKHSRTSMLFPLLTIHDSPNYSVRVLFPFVWRVRDHGETNTAVFPIYFGGRGPGFDWDGVFPLFVQTRTSVARTTVLGPLWYRARADGGRGGGLFPLLAYGKKVKDGKSASWFGMPGIYADSNGWSGTSHFWMLDFFHFRQPDGYTSGLVPLAFAWRRGTASKVLTPIYYRQADSARDYSLDVFTLFYVGHEGSKAHQFGLFPLLMEAKHADGSWWAELLPLFFVKHRTDGNTVLTLLGGYASTHDGSRLYVGPFYYRHDSAVRSRALFPIAYFGKNLVTGASTKLVLPLFLDMRGGDGRELQAYSPLVWRYHAIESAITVGIPLFFDVNRYSESRTTGLLPLLIRNRTEASQETSYVLPFLLTWWRSYDKGTGHASDFAIFPLVWHFAGDRNGTTIVAPFVWHFRRGDARTTVVFPLAARWVRPDGVSTLALNMYYRKGLGPREGSWFVDVFPLVQFGRPRKQDLEWRFLEGLFGYSRQGRNRNLRLLWVLDFALEPVPASNLSWFGSTPPEARELF